MQRKTKMLLGGGGALALLAAVAGIAVAQQGRGPGDADLNRDGQITAREIAAAARTRFAEADANKDGRLTGDELPRRHRGDRRGGRGHHGDLEGAAASPQPGQAAPGQLVPQAAATGSSGRPRMDANADGAVTLPEFYQGFRRRLTRADANGDRALSSQELAAAREHRRGRHHR
jgi:hypothetical protein